MRPLVRLVAGLVLAAAVGAPAIIAGPAAASCAEPSLDLLEARDVAFSGVVTERSQTGDDLVTTLRADRVFKGEVTRRVDVVSPADEVDSTMTAQVDEPAIVFADVVENEVTSSLCLTVVASDGAYREILADLGEGTEPSAGYMKVERGALGLTYEQFRAGRAVLGVLGLTAVGYLVFGAWRARRRTG